MAMYNYVIDSIWYDNIGIVLTYNIYEGFVYYIGNGDGYNQKEDENEIASWGKTFDSAAGDILFKWIENSDRYEKKANELSAEENENA